MLKKGAIVFCAILFIPLLVYAQIHYWVDAKGVKHYSSSPPESKVGIRDYQVVETVSEISTPETNEQAETTGASTAPQQKSYPKVVMYTTSWCSVCKKAKTWFQQNKIPYQEYDIEKDSDYYHEFKYLGGNGVPLIIIGNKNNRISGWDEDQARTWLGMNQ